MRPWTSASPRRVGIDEPTKTDCRTALNQEEMTSNAVARPAEAKERAWLAEVAALEESLKRLRHRRAEAEQRLPASEDQPVW